MKTEVTSVNTLIEEQFDFLNGSQLVEAKSLLYRSVRSIKRNIEDSVKSYLLIGRELNRIKENKSYLILNYMNIYEFTKAVFGFGETTTKNYINVFNRFGVEDTINSELTIKNNYSPSQLVEMLTVKDLSKVNDSMTIKEIRFVKTNERYKERLDMFEKEVYEIFANKLESLLSPYFQGLDVSYEFSPSYEDDDRVISFKVIFNFYSKDKNALRLVYDFDNERNVFYVVRDWELPYFYRDEVFPKNFMEFIEQLKNNTNNDFVEYIEKIKANIEREQKKSVIKQEEKNFVVTEELKNCPLFNLNNAKQREDFLLDMENYELHNQIPLLGWSFYEFKYNDLLKSRSFWLLVHEDGTILRKPVWKNKVDLESSVSLSTLVQRLTLYKSKGGFNK